jgi:hypothetical protein
MMESTTRNLSVFALRALWFAVRVPVFLFLKILQPLVTFVFSSLALLGLLTAFFYRGYGMPHFPFWGTIALSLGCGAVVMCWQALVQLLEA